MNYVPGDNGDNVLNGSQYEDSIVGYGGIDEMHGRAGNDLFDIVEGETGPGEVIDGGDGDDTIYCSGTLDFRPATLTSIEAVEFYLFETIVENRVLLSWNGGLGDALTITGSVGSDRLSLYVNGNRTLDAQAFQFLEWADNDVFEIIGGVGNQHLFGGSLGEALSGGAGHDTISGQYGLDRIDGGSGDDTLAGDDGDDGIVGGIGNDSLYGGEGDDTLSGGDGDDTIGGSYGFDLFSGGPGDDVLILDGVDAYPTFKETLDGGQGTDTVVIDGYFSSPLPITAFRSVERIEFYDGNAGITISERFLDDIHLARDITIAGGALADRLTLLLTRSVDFDVSSLSLESWSADDRLTIVGTSKGNTLIGSEETDELDGRGGDDHLIGNGNAAFEHLAGGGGNDTIEGGNGNDGLAGDTGSDWLDGGAGDDYLSEWTGVDTILGGEGNDITDLYLPTVGGDIIDGGEGTDQISVSAELDLRRGEFKSIEHLLLKLDTLQLKLTFAFNGASFGENGFATDLTIERPYGSHPAAIVTVYMGSATSFDGSSFSFVNWTARPEGVLLSDAFRILAGATADTLIGTVVNDTIVGGRGNDTITGGGGGDTLTGGAGHDIFVYLAVADTANALFKLDWITDLNAGDRIDLSTIDARRKLAGDQAFALDLDGSFSAGEIRQQQLGADVLLEFNTDGDAQVEMSLLVLNHSSLAGQSFIL